MTTYRSWFLTWRTYGTWLPGDERGSVGPVVNSLGQRVVANAPGRPANADSPALRHYARGLMRGEPIHLDPAHAAAVLDQLRETAGHRGWELFAVAVIPNHVHLLVGMADDPEPDAVLRDFKS